MSIFRRKLGMSFIEILLVVTITAAISAMGIVGLSQLSTVFKLRAAADEIRSQMQLGRELAAANRDQLAYQINLTSGVVVLRTNVSEIARFLIPAGVTVSPSNFTWGFTSLTGQLTGCPLPCTISLTGSGNTETVIFQANGIVN